jgi:hypothetical protein
MNIKGSGLDDWIHWHFFTITTNYNSSQSLAAYDLLHSLLDYKCEESLLTESLGSLTNAKLLNLHD